MRKVIIRGQKGAIRLKKNTEITERRVFDLSSM